MRCSLCNKEAWRVRTLLFERSREAICDECLAGCAEIVEEDSRRFKRAPVSLPKPSEIDDFLARLPERSWTQLLPLLRAPPSTLNPADTPSCSFCGDANPRQLTAGTTAFICDRCIAEGSRLLEQNWGLIEFHPPKIAASFPKPERLAPALSDGQRDRVLNGIREELRRRRDALSAAMQLAAATSGIDTTDVDEGPDATMDAETMLSSKARDALYSVVPLRCPVHIVGGTSQERRRVALRLHGLAKQPGPFVRIDCASPGSLARMREAENGTLFLDNLPLLSAAGQELLEMSLCDEPALRLSTRIVSTAHDSPGWDSRIEQGEFSETLFIYIVCICPLRIGP